MSRTFLAALAALTVASCSTPELGRRAMLLPTPTVPRDCMERMASLGHCVASIPPKAPGFVPVPHFLRRG